MATTRSPTGIRLKTATDTHTHAGQTHTANKRAVTQRTRREMERKILININVASGTVTPPFCHREAILQGQSGAEATELH